jgi:thiol-disulfide isomerase/thioredoxin
LREASTPHFIGHQKSFVSPESTTMKKIILPILLLIIVAIASVYWFQGDMRKVSDVQAAQTASSMAAFIKHPAPKDIAAFSFADGTGAAKDLSNWKGRVVLLNLWATWCGPCRKEMPELAKLQKLMGSADFEVVALSEDLKGIEASSKFLKETGSDNLALYLDQKATALAAIQSVGLPTTLLIDRNGKEVGRLLGPADWASPEAQALVKAVLDAK